MNLCNLDLFNRPEVLPLNVLRSQIIGMVTGGESTSTELCKGWCITNHRNRARRCNPSPGILLGSIYFQLRGFPETNMFSIFFRTLNGFSSSFILSVCRILLSARLNFNIHKVFSLWFPSLLPIEWRTSNLRPCNCLSSLYPLCTKAIHKISISWGKIAQG